MHYILLAQKLLFWLHNVYRGGLYNIQAVMQQSFGSTGKMKEKWEKWQSQLFSMTFC
jgi:hypothetical protein